MPMSSTQSGQNHSGSSVDRRTSSAQPAAPARRRKRVAFARSIVASSGRQTTSLTGAPYFVDATCAAVLAAANLARANFGRRRDAAIRDGGEQEVVDARR